MKILKNIGKNILLLFLVLVLSYFFAGRFYESIYPCIYHLCLDTYRAYTGGMFLVYAAAAEFLAVLVMAFIFFIILIFTAFGDSKKYWWIGILLIPAVAFELYFDLEHIYIPVIIGLIGWVIGLVISKSLVMLKQKN